MGGSVKAKEAGDWAQRQTGEGHRPDYLIPGTVFPSLLSSLSSEESCNLMF